jgi:hypothetical protein
MYLLQASQWLAGWLWGSLATRLCLEQAATYLMFGFIISMNFGIFIKRDEYMTD